MLADPWDVCQGFASSPGLFDPMTCCYFCFLAGSPSKHFTHPWQNFELSKWSLGPEASRSTWILKRWVCFRSVYQLAAPENFSFLRLALAPRLGLAQVSHLPPSCPHWDRVLSQPSTLSYEFVVLTGWPTLPYKVNYLTWTLLLPQI